MSTSFTDASPTLPLASVVAQPARRVQTDRELFAADRAALAPVRGVAAGLGVVYKIACRRKELHAALGLVYEAYVRAGLSVRDPYRMRVTPYHLLPTTEVFIAVKEGEVISTVSLVRDGELGLPMETIYGEEVARRRAQGISVGEASCLADRRWHPVHSFPLVARLMSFTVQCASYRGIDELLIAVHPRHGKFYQRFLGFRQIAGERTYQAVLGKPAIAMALDLNWAPIEHPRLYRKFFGTPFPDDVLRYRPMSDEVRYELSLMVEANRVAEPCLEPAVLAAC